MCILRRSTCLWFVFVPVVAPTQMRSSTSHALLTGCGVRGTARQSLPRLVGELFGRLWRFAMESSCDSTEMFQFAIPFARSQVVGDVGASMEKQRSRLRSSARLPPEAYRIRRMFHVFDVDSRPVPSGSSCSLSNQPLETLLCSRCAAEASLGRICRFCKPMPTRPSCTKDSGIFWCVCRFTFSEFSF